MRILAEQLNGETLDLEVTAEMTMRDVKMQIKRMHKWEDEMSRNTTLVEMILGNKKVTNEETVEELGLCDGSKVAVVFRKNLVQCCDWLGLDPDRDPEALVIVEILDAETEIRARAFQCCGQVATVIIPRSVTRIGDRAFACCSALAAINIPDSITYIGAEAFSYCTSLTSVDIPDSVTEIRPAAFDRSAFDRCTQLTLTAPARLLGPHVGAVRKVVATECGCGRCDWTWFGKGWVCPEHLPCQ